MYLASDATWELIKSCIKAVENVTCSKETFVSELLEIAERNAAYDMQ